MQDPRPQINEALKEAMKSKDTSRRDALRVLQSVFKQVEIDTQKPLTPEDAVALIQREIKKLRDSIDEKQRAGREDLVAKEEFELALLESFLPRQLSRAEIAVLVQEAIQESGAASPKDMGKLMGVLMPRVKGLADGKLVNEVVKEQLGKLS